MLDPTNKIWNNMVHTNIYPVSVSILDMLEPAF